MPDAPDAVSTPTPQATTPLWRNRNFVLMWTSTAASGFGDRMIMSSALALLGAFAPTSGSASINSMTQFFFVLPYVVLSLFVGWLADRLPRKWMLLFCDEGRAVLLLLAATMIPLVDAQAELPAEFKWKVLMLLSAIGCCAATFNPVRNAIVPDLMPRKQLQSANAVILTITVIASMVGQVIAPWIIDVEQRTTVRTALYLALGFYAVSGLFFAFLKPHQHELPEEEAKHHVKVHVSRFLRGHPRLIFLILVHASIWGVAAAVYSGVLAVGKINYSLADNELFDVFSVIGAALGIGMLVGAVLIGLCQTQRETVTLLAGSMGVAGLCVLIFAWSPMEWLGMLMAFLLGVCGNMTIITSLTLVQSLSPSYIRGRVMGAAAIFDNGTIVAVHLLVWRLGERSDQLLLIAMKVMGPVMFLFGLAWLLAYLRAGTMKSPGANFFRHMIRLFCLVWHRMEWSGRHHIPSEGPVIIAANHTTALDPFLMQAVCPRQIRWLMLTSYRFKAVEFFWKIIDPIFIDYDESGERVNASKQVRQIVKELKAGDCLGIFPEGHLQYDDRILEPFEDGVAVCAKLGRAQIVPCWIEGTEVSKSMLRHFLKPGHRHVAFGEPFTPDPKASPEAITAELRRRMIALASGPVEEAPLHAAVTT